MNTEKFINFMKNKTYIQKGEIKHYSIKAIESRLYKLRQLEEFFNINLDEKVLNLNTGIQFLKDIRNKKIEDLAHTPYSNAFRHYFECMTSKCIGRIF